MHISEWVPASVAAELDRLAGRFEIWLVGGAILDHLTGRACREVDAIAGASSDELADAGGAPIGGMFETHVWRPDGHALEISPRRGTLEADLRRRDFTIHAIAVRWPDGLSIDPTGGLRDHHRRLLRPPDPERPEAPFAADPVRILRGFRRVAEGYRWTALGRTAAWSSVPALAEARRERFGREWTSLLQARLAANALREMARWPGLLAAIHPAFRQASRLGAPADQRWDVWRHTAHVIEGLPPEPALRLAALFHDMGKVAPASEGSREEGEAGPFRIADHARRSAELATRVCKRWNVARDLRRRAARIVAAHSFAPSRLLEDESALRAWIAEHEDIVEELLAFKEADRRARGVRTDQDDLAPLARRVEALRKTDFPRAPSELAVDAGPLLEEFDVASPRRAALLDELWRWVLAAPERRNDPREIRARLRASEDG